MTTQSKSILLGRDLLKSWAAKIEGMKFKQYIKIVRRLQLRYRVTKEKRMKKYKEFNLK